MSGFFENVGSFLFGPSETPRLPKFTTTTPAFRLTSQRGATSLERLQTPELARRTQRGGRILGDIDVLRRETRPGFGRFTEAAVKTIRSAAARRIGNLRAQFSRRRVSGASFAEGEITSAQLGFAELEEQVRTQALLQEIATTTQLLTQEADLLQREVTNELAELNVATGFAQTMVSAISAQTLLEQRIQAEQIAGAGAALGEFINLGFEPREESSFFGGF